MTKQKASLSQWDALMLESLKAYGWSEEELIANARSGKLPKDESKFQFEYSPLVALANEEPETFERAVREGYQIKYNTIGGIRSWILVALQLEAELHLEPGEERVSAELTRAETERLQAVLSFGWQIVAEDAGAVASDSAKARYRIEPAQR
ncbi:hypothetical protein [Paenibacillus sp. GCM10027626]|uniref:hypothetical protein n=1 Tax=Paenibacillus sp. GCM10027626 TaxID=3273411 RepID=UPI00363B4A1D